MSLWGFFFKKTAQYFLQVYYKKKNYNEAKKTYNIHHVDNVLYDLILNKDTFSVRVNFLR